MPRPYCLLEVSSMGTMPPPRGLGRTKQGTKRIVWALVSAIAGAAALLLFSFYGLQGGAQAPSRPNILFVVTDDQPKDTMLAMPNVRERVAGQGVNFPNAYVSQSLCCPSRASILRGQYPHNAGVERNYYPGGGIRAFRENGGEADNVATRLHRSGYATALVGKYTNGYDASYEPPGWSYWYGRADPSFPGSKVRENSATSDYQGKPGNWGDRFRDKALGFLHRRTDQETDAPFALFFWSAQPHLRAGDYAKRYTGLYSGHATPQALHRRGPLRQAPVVARPSPYDRPGPPKPDRVAQKPATLGKAGRRYGRRDARPPRPQGGTQEHLRRLHLGQRNADGRAPLEVLPRGQEHRL